MLDVSIIMGARSGSKGRNINVRRTLQSYTKLSYKNYELVFIDITNNGNDLEYLYEEFKDKLPIRRVVLPEFTKMWTPETTWTPATTWNYGIRHSEGKFVIVTGGDILLSSPDLIEKFLDQYKGRRNAVLTHFISISMVDSLDGMDWMGDPRMVQNLSGYWDGVENGNINTNRTTAGHTTYLTGQPREDWEWIGLFRTDLSHLVNDQDLHIRENFVNRSAGTLEDYIGFHQAHPIDEPISYEGISPGWNYHSEAQARLQEPAPRDPI